MRIAVVVLAACALIIAATGVASAAVMWGAGSPDWSYGTSGPSPVAFLFETSTGAVGKTLTFGSDNGNWMWISGLADNGRFLYASHNIYDTATSSKTHDFRIAKIDRNTGAVLSDTPISGFLGQTYSQVNALDFHDGRLFAVENASSGSSIRGYAMEILLNAAGDVTGAAKGAFVGPYPDAGLDYHDGKWYATTWTESADGYKGETSEIVTSTDIMAVNFQHAGTASQIGMIDGLEFDSSGAAFGVTWYGPSPTSVYGLNTATWEATKLYDLSAALPGDITQLNALSDAVPEPATLAIWSLLGLGGGGLWVVRRRRSLGAANAPWLEKNRTTILGIIERGRRRE